jgi:hypothetical protein
VSVAGPIGQCRLLLLLYYGGALPVPAGLRLQHPAALSSNQQLLSVVTALEAL